MTSIPPADLSFIKDALHTVTQELLEVFEDEHHNKPDCSHIVAPKVLIESLVRLLTFLDHFQERIFEETKDSGYIFAEDQDINAFADYGLQLFTDLIAWAKMLDLSYIYDELRRLNFALGLWLVQHGAEITVLEPLVEHLAFVASGLNRPIDLEHAYVAASQIMDAVNPLLTQADNNRPNDPWRILILNRATIAARTQCAPIMEQAFQCLVELLPEDAASFFQETMDQADNLQYPEPARAVMRKYFQRWQVSKHLH